MGTLTFDNTTHSRKNVLALNAELKFIEFILAFIDKAHDLKTIGNLRSEFKRQFGIDLGPLLNQHFGIVRLIPLMYVVQDRFFDGTEDGKLMRAIRNAFAHNDFSWDENGYTFNKAGAHDIRFNYAEFMEFLHRIENEYAHHISFQV